MRTFAKCYPTQRWQIFRHYEPDIHFFVSIVDDEQAQSAELLREHYANVHIERIKDPELPEITIEAGRHAPYANAASHKKLLLQHWNQKRVWEFYCEARTSTVELYNSATIIRIRSDLWIHRFQKPVDPYPNEAVLPWWGKFGGVNDRLAILGATAAESYFKVYDKIGGLLEWGCPFHPETLTAAALRGFNIRPLMTEFSTMRLDGSQRWAEIVMSDVAELINGKA